MSEVRLDLIKLDGLIRLRAGDALLSDPELFGSAPDADRLFRDLLRKLQTSSAQAGSASAPPDAAASAASACQASPNKPAASARDSAEPERSALQAPAQERQEKQPKDHPEPSAADGQTTASSALSEHPAPSAGAPRRAESSPDTGEAGAEQVAAVPQDQDAAAQVSAAQLQLSAASAAQSLPEIQPAKALPEHVTQQKSSAHRPGVPGTPKAGAATGRSGELVESSEPETSPRSAGDPPEDRAAKPPLAEASPQRAPAAKITLGLDPASRQTTAGAEATQVSAKSELPTGRADGRPRAPQVALPASASAEEAAAANQAPQTSGAGIAAAAAQANQSAQASSPPPGPTAPSAASASQPASATAQGETARGTVALHAETQRPARALGAASPEGPEGDTKAVDRVRFVQRVARAFQALGQNRGAVRLRLHPPELGSLRVEVTVQRGVMTARLEAETTTARNLLLDNLPALRERLAQQDIRIQQFHVDLMDQPLGGAPDKMPEGWGSGGGSSGGQRRAQGAARAEEAAGPEPVAGPRPGGGNRLDVVV